MNANELINLSSSKTSELKKQMDRK